jgi:uncharacterized SAM-binding protein YcdF (DUF218 family)
MGAIFFMAPLAGGQVLHPGMWLPALALLLCAVLAVFPAPLILFFTGRLRVLARILAAFAGMGLLCMLAIFVWMGAAAGNAPPEDADVTVIVLGCRVDGDTPTAMLAARIDASYQFLAERPGVPCIVTGGLGSGANLTEARMIYNELVKKGIDGSRIFLEERSASTYQNFLYSVPIIEEHSLPRNVAIVSDPFHQLRASLFAKQNGLEPYAVSSASSWRTAPGYWVRESLAVVKALVLGN